MKKKKKQLYNIKSDERLNFTQYQKDKKKCDKSLIVTRRRILI